MKKVVLLVIVRPPVVRRLLRGVLIVPSMDEPFPDTMETSERAFDKVMV